MERINDGVIYYDTVKYDGLKWCKK